jgi:hypothetical protein
MFALNFTHPEEVGCVRTDNHEDLKFFSQKTVTKKRIRMVLSSRTNSEAKADELSTSFDCFYLRST